MHDILEPRHHMIDYVKFGSADPQAMCVFFKATLGWRFEWFGPDYVAFHGAGLEGASIAPTRRAGLQTAAP